VPDDAALAPFEPLLGRLHAEELVRPRDLLLAGVEDHEVADQVEEAFLVAELRQGPVEERPGVGRRAGRRLVLPRYEELLRRPGRPVAEPLRVAPRKDELDRGEEALVEDLLLVRDELAHAVADLHRAALELDHGHGEAVHVEDEVRSPLVAAPERHLLGQGEVVLFRVLPVDQVDRLVRLPCRDLDRHAVAQELVGAQVRLIERDARRIGGGFQLLKGRGDVGAGVPAGREVLAQDRRLDATVVLALAPVAEVAVAEPVGSRRVREERDDAALRPALRADALGHGRTSQRPPFCGPT
jgi:hypothetical protein